MTSEKLQDHQARETIRAVLVAIGLVSNIQEKDSDSRAERPLSQASLQEISNLTNES